VIAKDTAEHILSRKDFDRALRALLSIDEVLNRQLLFNFYKWAEQKGHTLPPISDCGSSDDIAAASLNIETRQLLFHC